MDHEVPLDPEPIPGRDLTMSWEFRGDKPGGGPEGTPQGRAEMEMIKGGVLEEESQKQRFTKETGQAHWELLET